MKEDMINIEYAITASKLNLCDIDTLVRTDKYGEEFLSCVDCIFNGVDKEFGLGIAGCPYECTGDEDVLR